MTSHSSLVLLAPLLQTLAVVGVFALVSGLREESHSDAHTRHSDDEHGREVDDHEQQCDVSASERSLIVSQERVDGVETVLTHPALDTTEAAVHPDRVALVRDVGEADEDGEEPREGNDLARATLALHDQRVQSVYNCVIPKQTTKEYFHKKSVPKTIDSNLMLDTSQ